MKSLENCSSFYFPLHHFFTIVVFVFVIALPISNCTTGNFTDCSLLWTCGAISNISYPFWGPGRPQYCGHPGFQLDCGNNTSNEQQPILKIGNGSEPYRVMNINKLNSSVTMVLQNMPADQHTCSSVIFKKALNDYVDEHIFAYSAGVSSISLLYNCDRNVTDVRYSVTCQSFTGNNLTSYYQRDVSKIPRSSKYCEQMINVPVLRSELSRLNSNGNETLVDVLKQGVEVEFDTTNCLKCVNSGGQCGYSDVYSRFVCFCMYHSSFDVCPKSISKSGLSKSWIIVPVFSAFGICILAVLLIYCLRRRSSSRTFALFWNKNVHTSANVDTFLKIYGSLSTPRYSYASIRKMTNDFKDKLGEGGYASVYKGKLFDGRLVAVKVLKQSKGDGEDFINEVVSITKTNHVNIVALLGFCFEGKRRALIYEFMSNGSLEKYTYDGASKESLSWETQFNIAIGIAMGLDYLHRGCNARILHFDIKPHNILLDEEFCPKISDFGLARLCPLQESTISMLEARGTIGYIAPEVFCRNFGGVSNKSDVYSFGMMVLDMVCGRTNLLADEQRSSELYFPQWIYNQLEVGEETAFQGTANDEEKALQKKMIIVSLWCIQTYPSNRPSMSRVIEMLQGCVKSIEEPPMPYPTSIPGLSSDNSSETPTQTLLPSS